MLKNALKQLRSWFAAGNEPESRFYTEEYSEPRYFTRAEAIAIARNEAGSSFSEADSLIIYTAYVEAMDDYCRVEFTPESEDQWVQTLKMLPQEERTNEQQITDEQIASVARAGRLASAIRLHRARYGTELAEAKGAVSQLINDSAS